MLAKVKNWFKNLDIRISKSILDHLMNCISDKEFLYITYYRFLNSRYLLTRLVVSLAIIVFYIEDKIYCFFKRLVYDK